MTDRTVDLGDEDRKQQRANARDALKEAQHELQQAAQRLVSTTTEICQSLDLTPSKDSAAAFSDLFVTIERAYDTVEEQLNNDLAAQQRQEGATQ